MKINLKSRKLWGGILTVLVLIVIAFVVISSYFAPETTTMVDTCLLYEDTEDCLLFPTISGENLLGDVISFPETFSTDYILVVALFGPEHLIKIDPWLEVVVEMGDTYPNLSYYGLPIFTDVSDFARMGAKSAMLIGLDGSLHDA